MPQPLGQRRAGAARATVHQASCLCGGWLAEPTYLPQRVVQGKVFAELSAGCRTIKKFLGVDVKPSHGPLLLLVKLMQGHIDAAANRLKREQGLMQTATFGGRERLRYRKVRCTHPSLPATLEVSISSAEVPGLPGEWRFRAAFPAVGNQAPLMEFKEENWDMLFMAAQGRDKPTAGQEPPLHPQHRRSQADAAVRQHNPGNSRRKQIWRTTVTLAEARPKKRQGIFGVGPAGQKRREKEDWRGTAYHIDPKVLAVPRLSIRDWLTPQATQKRKRERRAQRPSPVRKRRRCAGSDASPAGASDDAEASDNAEELSEAGEAEGSSLQASPWTPGGRTTSTESLGSGSPAAA